MKLLSLILCLTFLLALPLQALPEKNLFHAVKISDLLISENSLHCNTEILVLADVENKGTYSETVYVELANQPLGVHAFSPPIQLAPESRQSVMLPLSFSQEPQGTYTFEAYLHGSDKITQAYHSFTFAGCKTIHMTSFIQEQQPFTLPSEPKVTSAEQVSLLFVGTLLLVGILAILAALALISIF